MRGSWTELAFGLTRLLPLLLAASGSFCPPLILHCLRAQEKSSAPIPSLPKVSRIGHWAHRMEEAEKGTKAPRQRQWQPLASPHVCGGRSELAVLGAPVQNQL